MSNRRRTIVRRTFWTVATLGSFWFAGAMYMNALASLG